MTKQESFKRRIRSRMATTGERYAEARRVLLAQSSPSARPWVSRPELSDDSIRNGTGKGWDEWCDLLDAFPGRTEGHKAIAGFVRSDFGVGDWWAQAVTVGYERIVGLRLPHQMADGTFTANKSRTVSIDTDLLRTLLLDDEQRQHLFPDLASELRSKPEAKALAGEIYAELQAEFDNQPLNPELSGTAVQLAGFVAPLTYEGELITEFLLVPYFGACIHAPPPPVNQTVMVTLQAGQGLTVEDSWGAVWVTGTLGIDGAETDLATAGYSISSAQTGVYDEY